MAGNGLVQGVGTNNADYVIHKADYTNKGNPSGKKRYVTTWLCPFYSIWAAMLRRCYSANTHKRHPHYKGCTVCSEWLLFSNFRSWMVTQDWKGKQLDKDLLFEGNKVYSPETCVFIPQLINKFTLDSINTRGLYPIGVSWCQASSKFRAQCNNPFTRKQEYLGVFDTEIEAHITWKDKKHQWACQLANSVYVTDERIRQVLLNKYS